MTWKQFITVNLAIVGLLTSLMGSLYAYHERRPHDEAALQQTVDRRFDRHEARVLRIEDQWADRFDRIEAKQDLILSRLQEQ